MKKKKRVHHIGFSHAWEGLRYAFVYHHNLKFHLVISILVVLAGFYFQISKVEWVLLVFAIVFGVAMEMVNTAIESVVDLVTEEWRESAKIAKDVSSGAVLVTAVGTAMVGLIILGPGLFSLLKLDG